MIQYLSLLEEVRDKGEWVYNERTGIRCKRLQGAVRRYNIRDGFPLLTTKEMNWQHIVAETLWYLQGEKHIRSFQNYARYWDAWADDRGNLESAYGRFWRSFPIPSENIMGMLMDGSETWEESDRGVFHLGGTEKSEVWMSHNNPYVHVREGLTCVDQLAFVVDEIKRNPSSRRLIVSAWHPGNALVSSLPPCHDFFQFSVVNGNLDLTLYQRSADVPVGVPYNIATYALLLMLVALDTGLRPRTFIHFMADAHIYENQMEQVHNQLKRDPNELPQMLIRWDTEVLDLKLCDEDMERFALINYYPQEAIKYEVAV